MDFGWTSFDWSALPGMKEDRRDFNVAPMPCEVYQATVSWYIKAGLPLIFPVTSPVT
jgi:hypothetical protein